MKPETFASLVSAILYEKRLPLITEVFVYHIFCPFGILKGTYYATFAGFSFCATVCILLTYVWLVDT